MAMPGQSPDTSWLPAGQGASVSLGSGNSLRSRSGSIQPEPLCIEYPLLSLGETTPPPATSMSRVEKKDKGKAKARGKKKKKQVSVPPDSPAMATRSKTSQRQSPASHTRRKRKLQDLNL